MKPFKPILVATLMTLSSAISTPAFAAERWQEANFPPPNGGHLVFAIMADGNPGCASYDGASCLWGTRMGDIDFSKVKPLVCGAQHRRLYGVTGFEDPKHWCNLAPRANRTTQRPPATPPAPTPTPAPAPADSPPKRRTPAPSGPSPDGLVSLGHGRRPRLPLPGAMGPRPAGGPGKTVEARLRHPQSRQPALFRCSTLGSTAPRARSGAAPTSHSRPVKARRSVFARPNCGSASNPDIRPNVVRAGKFD